MHLCQVLGSFSTGKMSLQENKMSNMPARGTALVTGASSGIGAIYGDRLAKMNS
jgi:hypothetical protein